MVLNVVLGDEFEELPGGVQDALLASAKLLVTYGPHLGRPYVDTLKASAFAFDPERRGILLIAGDKPGGSEKRFYKMLTARADWRYRFHLDRLATTWKGRT